MTEVLVCDICQSTIEVAPNGWDRGHNAWPVTEGRCCGPCNTEYVIPTRLLKSGFSTQQILTMADIIE